MSQRKEYGSAGNCDTYYAFNAIADLLGGNHQLYLDYLYNVIDLYPHPPHKIAAHMALTAQGIADPASIIVDGRNPGLVQNVCRLLFNAGRTNIWFDAIDPNDPTDPHNQKLYGRRQPILIRGLMNLNDVAGALNNTLADESMANPNSPFFIKIFPQDDTNLRYSRAIIDPGSMTIALNTTSLGRDGAKQKILVHCYQRDGNYFFITPNDPVETKISQDLIGAYCRSLTILKKLDSAVGEAYGAVRMVCPELMIDKSGKIAFVTDFITDRGGFKEGVSIYKWTSSLVESGITMTQAQYEAYVRLLDFDNYLSGSCLEYWQDSTPDSYRGYISELYTDLVKSFGCMQMGLELTASIKPYPQARVMVEYLLKQLQDRIVELPKIRENLSLVN